MADNLVVVESPAKAKTINKYLGKSFVVKASMGHVKDLPKSKLGVDVEHGFEPQYIAVRARLKVLKELKAEAKKAKRVYIATDPDREGEAIGWHLSGELKTKANEVVRVRFHEITKAAILKAVAEPLALDMPLVNAQQARRVLDRLVGYSLSPLLWKSIRRGLSAGRVQSIGVRLVVDREGEIQAFVAEEYWDLCVDLQAKEGRFQAHLASLGGEKCERLSPAEAQALATELDKLNYRVGSLQKKEQRRFPGAPYTTSTLQQDAARKLRFSAKRTMSVAQQLYEGLDIGPEGSTGLITYMRTDSVRVSSEAQQEARGLIAKRFGKEALPDKPPFYKAKRPGQDGHEAVRPTSALREPSAIAPYLSPDQNKLYGLVWRRFIASQMTFALFDATTVEVPAARPKPAPGTRAGDALFRASGAVLRAPGFLAVYGVQAQAKPDAHEDEDEKKERDEREEKQLPALTEGEALRYLDSLAAQHFTQPLPRYSDATLVKALEELGIGRPSTYVSIINTILDRLYVERIEGGRLKPTELGTLVNKLLVEHFKDVLNVDFTAQMEAKLDSVEAGEIAWQDAVASFYGPFVLELEAAKLALKDSKKALETVSDVACDLCGKMMVVKWGRMGKFLACPGYPDCKGTKPLLATADGSIKAGKVITTDEVCEKCGKPMLVKTGRFGRFIACSGYPQCKSTKPLNDGSGIACPKCGEGHVVQRRSKRGRSFYGCDKYPQCDFVAWGKPIAKGCPACGAKYLVEKSLKSGVTWACATEGCGHKEEPSELLADLKRQMSASDIIINVVGGGMAGCEAAVMAARLGAKVRLFEMRPTTPTPAHTTDRLAELVCSNSLKSLEALSAPWILKREMLRLGSATLPAAFAARVPAGINLSVDRSLFSDGVEAAIKAQPGIEIVRERVDALPDDGLWIVATGPLTGEALAADLQRRLGEGNLYFFDAIAPIVTAESIDPAESFAANRWGRGTADYINCPLDQAQYEAFVALLLASEKAALHGFEAGKFFEACLPIEETARRGKDTLRFGPMKPVGLTDPKTGRRPYACLQLRQENAAASLYNLVGFQTQLKWGAQEKLLRSIPALAKAEFARFGSLHRNTYVNAPAHLNGGVQLKSDPRIFLAGQLTGVEGYVESAASGMLAGLNAVRHARGLATVTPPRNSMLGALMHYLVATEAGHFQPINAMWGLVEPMPAGKKEAKHERYLRYRARALDDFEAWAGGLGLALQSDELLKGPDERVAVES